MNNTIFKLPKIDFAYNAFEPYIDSHTMEIHYTKHHQSYVDKLNIILEKYPKILEINTGFAKNSIHNIQQIVFTLLKNKTLLNQIVKDKNNQQILQQIRDCGGGHINHSLFWEGLKVNVTISDAVSKTLNKNFDTFKNFVSLFQKNTMSLFGSGWTWLVFDEHGMNKMFKIINTRNQESPEFYGYQSILGIDLWEHAYYLKYQNDKAKYVENFFKIINWNVIEKRMETCLNKVKK